MKNYAHGRSAGAWTVVRVLLRLFFVVFVLAPILYMILVSLTPESQIEGGASLIPASLDFSTYSQLWQTVDLADYIRNSLIISVSTAAIATILALGAAYVLARFAFRGNTLLRLALIGLQAVPSIMLLLPLFVVYVAIQDTLNVTLIGHYPIVILTYMTFALPFATWLMLSYVNGIPVEMEESALVDGASRLGVLRFIILPLALPGMVVTFVLSFLPSWGDVLFASVLTSPTTRTVAVGLQEYIAGGEAGGSIYWNQLIGASLISSLPIIVLFLLFQRVITGGLTAGALKG
jgi:multiple sugar transport system permease protein